MALFNKNTNTTESTNDKAAKLLKRYGLESVDPKYTDSLQKIATLLAGSGMSEFGALLSNDDKAMNKAQTQYVHAIFEQNFIIIRQLDELINVMSTK